MFEKIKGVKRVAIDDLPKYSEWPSRLLQLTDWDMCTRDTERSKKEYAKKWRNIFTLFKKYKKYKFEKALDRLYIESGSTEFLVFVAGSFYWVENSSEYWDYYYSFLICQLKKYINSDDTLIELGSGWGRNLFYLYTHSLYGKGIGGELTTEGIDSANVIASHYQLPITFYKFDYNKPSKFFLSKMKGAAVLTQNSIEQIPNIKASTLLKIAQACPKVVCHFEPVYEHNANPTMFHLMCRRYTEMNDYNRNLLSVLKQLEQKGYLQIIKEQQNVIGTTAFNPCSIIIWKPLI